jgi:phytoene dehydrogenase-like protein
VNHQVVTEEYDSIIIGAGLSGLACALKLQENGQRPLVLEKETAPGGRVRTDEKEGFLLDRGFQVYLDAYPCAQTLLDHEALDLRPFEPGALVRVGGNFHRVMDVFRRPKSLLSTALSPVGTFADKLRIAQLRNRCRYFTLTDVARDADRSTEEFLQLCGFSRAMIEDFFRSFYGGVFHDNSLRTASRFFRFTFKMFSEGMATLPAKGMEEIPRQLASRLPQEDIQCGVTVAAMTQNRVRLRDGRVYRAKNIVLAMPADAAKTLVPSLQVTPPKWRSSCTLYFAAPESPLKEPILVLGGSECKLVNHLAVPSDLSPYYAPSGQALIAASVLGLPDERTLLPKVREELVQWFGPSANDWRHLHTNVIKHALPAMNSETEPPRLPPPRLFFCGDHQTIPSIEGAITSGQKTAEAILGQA